MEERIFYMNMCIKASLSKKELERQIDSGIHKKARHELLVARQKIGCIEFGDAVITSGFELDAKYVIHTVGERVCFID